MNKKIVYLFFVSIFFYYNGFCQKELKRTICCCSTIINQLSSEWKKDSLANNDFRKLNSNLLLTCKLDTITVSFLMRKFGKPSEIRNINHGIEYLYYYFDIRTRPKKIMTLLLQ